LIQKNNVFYYLILSIVAGFFILLLAFFESSGDTLFGFYDKFLVALLFIVICLFGISLAFYPRWYKRFKSDKKVECIDEKDNKKTRRRKGHHPDCIQFKKHTLKIKYKAICAGCLGLALGSIVSIVLICIYLFFTVNYPVIFHWFLILGLFLVFQIYLEIMISKRNTTFHIFSNVLHVVGFLLISISIFEITGSVICTSIAILISFLFLDTRIQLSLYNHSLVCKKCEKDCKMY